MMRDRDLRLKEDRALRDAAKALITADIAILRANLAGKGFGERIADRINEGATDLFEEAVDLADSNRGVMAALLAAVLLWFTRNPIIALFTDNGVSDDADEIEQEALDEAEPA